MFQLIYNSNATLTINFKKFQINENFTSYSSTDSNIMKIRATKSLQTESNKCFQQLPIKSSVKNEGFQI